ncbi:putative aspartic-type endopeptidase CTSD [Fonsecaea pedrosoi]|nr:putative aspartic-type endopeptidase CTSD [Fonsecaea pedrosoi]
MHRRWLSVPLLSSCVSAFYPYHTGDGGHENNKRFIPLGIEPVHEGDSVPVTIDIKKAMVKRNNLFPVLNSSAPDVPNAMAISQDGSDYTYFSTMKFGSKGQEMYMLIDSGSANTWVMGTNCKSNACQIHNTYGSEDSTTLETTTQTWSMTYGTGEVEGVVVKDTVQLANYSIELGFGLASSASDDFNNYPMDGILGLGRPASDALGSPTVMQVLDDKGHLSSNILGIHLQRSSDGTNDGQITFGGIDSSRFNGKLSYSKTINSNSWQINADDAGVDGKSVRFKSKTAMIDTGTSYILLPPDDAEALHELIPGSDASGETFTIPCSSSANVYFTISGVKYSVSPKDYVGKPTGSSGSCQSNIIGHQAFGPDDWILGDVFLKNVYTVLDFDNARVGFGTKSGAGSAGDNTATTSGSTLSATSSARSSSASASASGSGPASKSQTTIPTSITSKPSTLASTVGGGAPSASSTGASDSSPFGESSGSGSSSSSSSSTYTAADSRANLLLPLIAFAFIAGLIL